MPFFSLKGASVEISVYFEALSTPYPPSGPVVCSFGCRTTLLSRIGKMDFLGTPSNMTGIFGLVVKLPWAMDFAGRH